MSSGSLLSKKPSGLFPNNNKVSSNSQFSQNLKMSLQDSSTFNNNEGKEDESELRKNHTREMNNLKDEFDDEIFELKRKHKVYIFI